MTPAGENEVAALIRCAEDPRAAEAASVDLNELQCV